MTLTMTTATTMREVHLQCLARTNHPYLHPLRSTSNHHTVHSNTLGPADNKALMRGMNDERLAG